MIWLSFRDDKPAEDRLINVNQAIRPPPRNYWTSRKTMAGKTFGSDSIRSRMR